MKIRSPIGIFVALSFLGPVPEAQARDEVTFRAPVEITNIKHLFNARMRCILSDRSENESSYTAQHSISNDVTLWFLPPDDLECRSRGRSNNAALRCATSGEHGLSWSGDMEVTVRDFDSGLVKVQDAQHYLCKLSARYDVDPQEVGFRALADRNCSGFDGPHNRGREIYQTLTGGDIESAVLCWVAAFKPGPNLIRVPGFHVHGTAPGSRSTQDDTQGQTVFRPRGLQESVPSDVLPAPEGSRPRPMLCFEAVQGRIAWNQHGNTRWTQANIDRLCAGAEDSAEPARCFQQALKGAAKLDSGRQWTWKDAVDLCQGTRNAAGTVSCFEETVRGSRSRQEAIEHCGAKAVVNTKP